MIRVVLFLVTAGHSYYTQREKAERKDKYNKYLEKYKADQRKKFDEGPKMHWTIHDYLESPSCADSHTDCQ